MIAQWEGREEKVLVLDTNIVLDLFVYEDPATAPLFALLAEASNRWLATAAMREELGRVLSYSQIAKRLNARSLLPETVLLAFDARAEVATTAAKAPYTCKDAD
ncbi:MAG: PIN domain-containing protein, partial [Hydrogenophaga sp.]